MLPCARSGSGCWQAKRGTITAFGACSVSSGGCNSPAGKADDHFRSNMSHCEMVVLGTEHLEEAVRFICGQIFKFRNEVILPESVLPRYRWLLVNNPRRPIDFIGWGLRTGSGE